MSRSIRLVGSVGAMILLSATSAAVTAQDEPATEELERPGVEVPVEGYERSDGIVVLTDRSWCSHLLGAIWGSDELTFSRLLDRSKKQKKARRAAFMPATDEALLDSCVAVLDAYRQPTADPERLAAWAREHPVLPATLARFLPADPATDPLASPPEIGDGARTSGFGSRRSAPFTLWGGAYHIEPSREGCETWTGTIRRTDDPQHVLATVDGPLELYGVEMSTWFWDVSASDCDWSVDIVPVVVAAPTPTPRPLVEVPRLMGSEPWAPQAENPEYLTVEQAREALQAAGLVVGACEIATLRVEAPRRVIGQDPAPGTMVEPGSAVNVVVREEGCDVLTAS